MRAAPAWPLALAAGGLVWLAAAPESAWAAPTEFLGDPIEEAAEAMDAGGPPEPVFGETAPAAAGWREFLRQRTRWGMGVDEQVMTNVFSTRGATRQEDIVTIAESQVAFADPRGDWLYGGSYEVNSWHYHDLGEHPFTHEFRTYAHYTPLGRYQLALANRYEINQRLATEAAQADAIRRFATVTEQRSNAVSLEGSYDLNATNALRGAYSWGWVRDKAPDGAASSSDTHQVTVGMDHDVSRRLTLFGGYTISDTTYLKAPSKDVFEHGLAAEARYDLDPTTTTKFSTSVVQRDPATGPSDLTLTLGFVASRLLTPRSRWAVTLNRKTLSSVTSSTGSFTSHLVSWQVVHALTPRISASWEMAYENVKTTTTRSDRVSTALEMGWQIRPNISGVLSYRFQTLNQDDIINHVVGIGVEAQIW